MRHLSNLPYPELSTEERAFLDGPVHEVCAMTDDWDVWQKRDLPPDVWQFLKDNGFFGMIIPHEHGGLLAVTLSGLAHSHVKALGLLGRYEEQIAAADRYIEMYGVRPLVASLPRLRPEALIAEPPTTAHVVFEPKNLRLLRLARIEALIGLRRIDEANSALNADPALLNDPIAGFEANRLRNQLIQVMQDPRKPKWQGTNAPAPLSGEALIKGLREILRDEFEGEQKESLLAAVDRLDPNNHLDPTDPDQRALAEEMKTAAEAYLTEGTRPDLEILFRHAEELSSKLKK